MKNVRYFSTLAALILCSWSYCESTLTEHKSLSSERRIIWTKLATVCMRRELYMKYRVKYNSERGCCPKLLFYSDEQYQRIIFLKALLILQEEEIAKITGIHKTKIYPSNSGPYGRKRRSLKTEQRKANNINTKYLSINKTDSDQKRNILTRKSKLSRAKHLMSLLSFAPKINHRKRRDVSKYGTNVTYSEVIQKLYHKDKSFLFEKAEKRVRETFSCKEANAELIQVLDPTQIIELCPKAGISIDPTAKGSRMCDGTIRPVHRILLPRLNETQSWYGYSERSDGNENYEFWEENTWHVALFNCPKSPPMNLTYIIEFDVDKGKQTKGKDYLDSLLDTRCKNTVLPLFSKQDGIERGMSFKAKLSTELVYMITFVSILVEMGLT